MTNIQTVALGVPEYDIQREGTCRSSISPDHLHRLSKKKPATDKEELFFLSHDGKETIF